MLARAIAQGNISVVRVLLGSGIPVTTEDLEVAALGTDTAEIITTLLDHGAKPNLATLQHLKAATPEIFLDAFNRLDKRDMTAMLPSAVRAQNLGLVSMLISHGAMLSKEAVTEAIGGCRYIIDVIRIYYAERGW
jgi:hypothetical protein